MLGAGDIIGSVYESHPTKSMDFPLFGKRSECTDDSILTTAVAETLLTDRPYKETMREFALENSDAGFGGMFRQCFTTQGSKPYNSFWQRLGHVRQSCGLGVPNAGRDARRSPAFGRGDAQPPGGIKGAQSVAAAIFLARKGATQADIRDALEQQVGYDLHRAYEEIQPSHSFDSSCQGSVPEAN